MVSRCIRALRGRELRCKGWRQESLLRLLENNLEVGEDPENLVIYGGGNKAARSWDDYDAIVSALTELEEDQTLVIQSGRAIGVFSSHKDAPLVVMANGIFVNSTTDEMQWLIDNKLSVKPGMTAAAWQYIGSQGILQGTYQTFVSALREIPSNNEYKNSPTILSAGCGGMSGAQGRAGALAGASTLIVEARKEALERRLAEGYLDEVHDDFATAFDSWCSVSSAGQGRAIGVAGNVVDFHEWLFDRGFVPDVVTDQVTTEPFYGYIPRGMAPHTVGELRTSDRTRLLAAAADSMRTHMAQLVRYQELGSIVFEYGNELRQRSLAFGYSRALDVPGFVDRFIRKAFCRGSGPFRYISIGGNADAISTIDRVFASEFADNEDVVNWLQRASSLDFSGLPARICWFGHGERSRAGVIINDLIKSDQIEGPIALTRDHLDSGSVTSRYRESEGMLDGTDAIGDWPILSAMISGAGGADLVSVHGSLQLTMNAGPTVIADGSDDAARRIQNVLDGDTGLGVLRHASAGFEDALQVQRSFNLGLR